MATVTNDPEIVIKITDHETHFKKITCQVFNPPMQAGHLEKVEGGASNKFEFHLNKIIDENKFGRLIRQNALKHGEKEFIHHTHMPYVKLLPFIIKSNFWLVISLGVMGIFFNFSNISEIVIIASTIGYHISFCLALYAYSLVLRERKNTTNNCSLAPSLLTLCSYFILIVSACYRLSIITI